MGRTVELTHAGVEGSSWTRAVYAAEKKIAFKQQHFGLFIENSNVASDSHPSSVAMGKDRRSRVLETRLMPEKGLENHGLLH